jgi:hypothetical protein
MRTHFDKTIDFVDVAAPILLAPLLVHFRFTHPTHPTYPTYPTYPARYSLVAPWMARADLLWAVNPAARG